jgi:NADH-quinone oxidoreductase subunit C
MSALLKAKLESTFNDVQVSVLEETRMAVSVPSESTFAVLRYLRDNGFDHLALVSCVDWIEQNEFEIVYILTSYMRSNADYASEQKLHLFLKTRISRKKPELKSVTVIFESAEPYEREIHELFGVHFEGHPRLIPLFLERDYEIPPFRKDFDTRKYVEETFDSIPSVED